MSESRHRSEVVSTRLSPEEVARIRKQAGDKGVSTYLRERALATAEAVTNTANGNPHMIQRRGEAWILQAAPGRIINILRAPGYQSNGVAVWTPADARKLAAALLTAADLAEQPDPDEAAA